jgi:L-serine dehydratase
MRGTELDDLNEITAWESIAQIVNYAESQSISISEAVLRGQMRQLDMSRDELTAIMRQRLHVMREGIERGLDRDTRSLSGLSGGNAWLLRQARSDGRLAADGLFAGLMIKAMAMSEHNAAMGRIVACPTAGSCGIVPAVLLTLMEERGIPEESIVMALFHVAGVGMVIAGNASVSGAQGGCQAECGSACAMAASAAVELLGGSPRMSANACAMAMKTLLGLVCDPVAGLVEVPCIKRNVSGAVNAMVAANLALAGIESVIPADEVIAAMKQVGDIMSSTLKETALGGLAATPTALKIAEALRKRQD